ncbi:14782_t:CDS:2 [Entrophospora sp. SA101]|nr:14782_t:CDS:2 [Entrophospora sp. SA101]
MSKSSNQENRHRNRNARTLERWYSGTLERSYSGTLVLWNSRTLERSYSRLWDSGTQELRCSGHWYPGTLVPWNTGTLGLWYPGTLELSYSGTLVHWNTVLTAGSTEILEVVCPPIAPKFYHPN